MKRIPLHSLASLRRTPWLTLSALVIFCALMSASVIHPLVHDHEHEDEACEVAKCLGTPETTADTFVLELGLVEAGLETAAPSIDCLQGVYIIQVARGPPSGKLHPLVSVADI